jgi:TolB-like protein
MNKLILNMVLLILTLFVSNAFAGDNVSVEMEKVAKQFSDIRPTRFESQPTLAVLPFQAEEKLAKRGIGLAIAEMLTSHIFHMKNYKIVERAELKKVLDEHKLGLSGVVDSNSAIAVGHILGCQIIVAGNVVRLGDNYQISARMIDVSSGEVVTMAFAEISATALDEEAKKYMVLVPEEQAIGIFVYLPVSKNPIRGGAFSSGTRTSKGVDLDNMPQVGVRYYPLKWLFLELMYMPKSGDQNPYTDERLGGKVITTDSLGGSVNFQYAPFNYLKSYFGVGFYSTGVEVTSNSNSGIGGGDDNFIFLKLSAGLEVRPLSRIGIGYNLDFLSGSVSEIKNGANETIFKPELNNVVHKFHLALYF